MGEFAGKEGKMKQGRGEKATSEVDKLVFDGILDELGIGLHIHLVKYMSTVCPHGGCADGENLCHLGNGFPLTEEAQNLKLTIGERFVGQLMRGHSVFGRELLHER